MTTSFDDFPDGALVKAHDVLHGRIPGGGPSVAQAHRLAVAELGKRALPVICSAEGDDDRAGLLAVLFEVAVAEYGLFPPGVDAGGAMLVPADRNALAAAGARCDKCIFWMGPGCAVVEGVETEDWAGAVCRLWTPWEDDEDESDPNGANHDSPDSVDDSPDEVEDARWQPVRKEAARRYTLAPWYVPDRDDAHDEWTDSAELQQALWSYVRAGDRRIRLQHDLDMVAGEWVEAVTWPYEVTVPLIQPDGQLVTYTFPADTVFLGVIWEPWAWDRVLRGEIRGYSIGGQADRVGDEG